MKHEDDDHENTNDRNVFSDVATPETLPAVSKDSPPRRDSWEYTNPVVNEEVKIEVEPESETFPFSVVEFVEDVKEEN